MKKNDSIRGGCGRSAAAVMRDAKFFAVLIFIATVLALASAVLSAFGVAK